MTWRSGRPTFRCHLLNEEGSTLVETAFACMILVTVLIGIFDMSRAVYAAHAVSEAAREATRYAIVRGSNCINLTGCAASNSDIQTYVQSLGYPGITAAKLTTATTWYNVSIDTTTNSAVVSSCGTAPNGCNSPGNQVQVQVSYSFSFNIMGFAKTLNLTSTSAMVISQ
jgi:Flp pilus assembly protein TadG